MVSKDEEMRDIGEKLSTEHRKNSQKVSKEAEEQRPFEKQRETKRAACRVFEWTALKSRVLSYGGAAVLPRSLKLRAAVAKDRKRTRSGINE